jgi:hypothetical protein
MANMSMDTPHEIRQYVEERKRINLTETRELIDRLEKLVTEVESLRTRLAEAEQHAHTASAAGVTEAPPDVRDIPAPLAALLEQARTASEADHPDSLARGVFAWCDTWLTVRAQLRAAQQQQAEASATLHHLTHEADQLVQRFTS